MHFVPVSTICMGQILISIVLILPPPPPSPSPPPPPFPSFPPPSLPEPSSPPEGVQLVPVDSTSLRLEWGLPPELERNGIITQYVVDCTGIASVQSPMVLPSPTFNTPPSLQQLLTGLSSFTNYSCRVAAANVNGSGPFSALASASTLEGCELHPSPEYPFCMCWF